MDTTDQVTIPSQPMPRSHHTCPVHGCTRTVPFAKVMCFAHWGRVPAQLQTEVYEEWRNRPGGPLWREARRAAIDAVNALVAQEQGRGEGQADDR